MRGVFVTGTDTGVGKTVFSAGLAWALRRRGVDVGVMKPFATADAEYSKEHRSADVGMLSRAAETGDLDSEVNPSFYTVAASPYAASLILGKQPPRISEVLRILRRLAARHEFLIVEGIGGLMVPLTESISVADFAKKAGMPVVVVSRASLGTLNHTILTVNGCRSFGLKTAGIVVNMMPARPTPAEANNPIAIEALTKVPLLGVIPKLRRPSYVAAGREIEKRIDIEPLLALD